jgi:hypothetical protein
MEVSHKLQEVEHERENTVKQDAALYTMNKTFSDVIKPVKLWGGGLHSCS